MLRKIKMWIIIHLQKMHEQQGNGIAEEIIQEEK